MNGSQRSPLSQVASLLAETATDQGIASLVRALLTQKRHGASTLSSVLTAIYATLNVACSIGVFRSNQEIPIQWIGSYSFKEEQFRQGIGKGHIPGP